MFAQVYEQASLDHPDIVFAKVDTQAEQQLAASARITSIPTLMAFRGGVLVFSQPGALPLSEQGFGILTEIDLQATLKAKIDASRPPLVHAAVQAEPSIGLLLPFNVVVRALAENRTAIEAMDPAVMVQLTGNDALIAVADEAGTRLSAALDSLGAGGA